MYIIKNYRRDGKYILLDDNCFCCPVCKEGQLLFLDYCKRIVRYEGGEKEWIMIPRHKCDNEKCRKIHRMLPDFLVPYKHYSEEVISGVLENIVCADDMDSENYPNDYTMYRWQQWFAKNEFVINECFTARKKSYGIGLSFEDIRLLYADSWLKYSIACIYNCGGRLFSLS